MNSSSEYKKLGNAKGFPKSISRAKIFTAAAAAAVISSGAQSKEITVELPEQVLDKVHQIQAQPSGSQMRLGTINGGYRLEKSSSGVRIYQGDTFLGTVGDSTLETIPKISKVSNGTDGSKIKFTPGPSGMGLSGTTAGGTQFSANMGKYSQYGVTADLGVAGELSKNSALALNVEAGPKLQRLLTTLGFSFDNGVLMFSAEHLGVKNKFQFSSGDIEKMVRQNSVGTTLKLYFSDEILKSLEVSGYITKAQSYQLSNKEYSVNNETIFAIYDNFRNIAGGEKKGIQTKFNFAVGQRGELSLGLNYESLNYDMKYSPSQKHAQFGGTVGYSHNFGSGLRGDVNLRTGVSSTDIEAGLSKNFQDGSRFGVVVRQTQGKNGGQNDTYVGVQYSIPFGGKTNTSSPINFNNVPKTTQNDSYIQKESYAPSRAQVSRLVRDVISQNTSFKSSTTLHIVDQKSVRILEIDKTQIPDGVTLLNEQGDFTISHKIASINTILKNGSSFSNTGEFQLVGEAFVVKSRNFREPAKGTTDTYNVNLSKVGGGQVNVTIDVRAGSIIISKVVVEEVNAIDKTGLNTLIGQAETKVENTYTPTSWAAFFSVLKAAIVLRDNTSATQVEIDEVILKLQKAVENLQEKANVSILTTKLQEAQQLFNTGTGKYTPESLNKLSQAITSAQTILANADATQTEVDNVVLLLGTAIQGVQLLNQAPTVVSAIANITQDEGTAVNINVTGKFSDPEGGTLVYSGTNLPTGVTINSTTGVISGILPTVGSDTPYVVTIRATDVGGLYVEQNFTITVKNIVVAPVDPTINFGTSTVTRNITVGTHTQTLTTNSPGAVTYSSSNPSVATVNATTGVVTFVGVGNVTITANQVAAPGYNATSASYGLTIEAAPVAPVDPTINFGTSTVTRNITVGTHTQTLTTNSPGAVTYSSSNPSVATVNATTGVVTFVGVGNVTITANQVAAPGYNATSASYGLTIEAAPVAPVDPTINFGTSTVTRNITVGTHTQTLTTNSPGAVTYSSSNPSVATVNATTGVVTFVGVGNVTITANQVAAPGYNATSASYGLTIEAAPDNQAPTLTSLSLTNYNGHTRTASVPLSVNGSDNIGITGYYVQVVSGYGASAPSAPSAAAGGWQASISSATISAQGYNTVYVWAKDAAGNVSNSISQPIYFDNIAPTASVSFSGSPGVPTQSVILTVTLGAVGGGGSTETQSVPGDAPSGWTAGPGWGQYTKTVYSNQNVTYTFSDAAGNTVQITPDVSQFNIDNTPATASSTLPMSVSAGTPLSGNITFSEPVMVEVLSGGSAFGASDIFTFVNNLNINTTAPTETGNITLSLRLTDRAGNESTVNYSVGVTPNGEPD